MTQEENPPSVSSSFILEGIEDFLRQSNRGKYLEKIDSLTGSYFLIDYLDVFDWDNGKKDEFSILNELNKNTAEWCDFASDAIKRMNSEKHGSDRATRLNVFVGINDSPIEISLNEALKDYLPHQLVKLTAMVSSETDIKKRLKNYVWLCPEGHKTNSSNQDRPAKCSNPRCIHRKLELVYRKSEFMHYRRFYLKELNNYAHHADTLAAEATNYLTDYLTLGSLVQLVGYLRFEHVKNNILTVFVILHAKKLEEITLEITDEDRKRFESYPMQDGFYNKFLDSIAPDVHNARRQKEAWAISHVGSPKWAENQRYWINVLVVGDPAVAKTAIGLWASKKLPNVEMASNTGSAKGLYAGLKKQADDQQVLEAGPLVRMSDHGQVVIDEFMRFSNDIYDAMYTPMDSGLFPSNTVGGHANLPARTPIYATGNPYNNDFWDENKTLAENLQILKPALLSRFDFIIIVKDKTTKTDRTNIARAMMDMPLVDIDNNELQRTLFDENEIVKYLLYCKTINPEVSLEIKKKIVCMFTDIMEKKGNSMEQSDINNRLVGIINRVVRAIARIHLHREVTESDVVMTHQIMKSMYEQRGFRIGDIHSTVSGIGDLILNTVLNTGLPMSDKDIYDKLLENPNKLDYILNGLGISSGKYPSRATNRHWREVMAYVEHSDFVEVVSEKPRSIRRKKIQTILS